VDKWDKYRSAVQFGRNYILKAKITILIICCNLKNIIRGYMKLLEYIIIFYTHDISKCILFAIINLTYYLLDTY